jgi:hypothetical protein
VLIEKKIKNTNKLKKKDCYVVSESTGSGPTSTNLDFEANLYDPLALFLWVR